MTNAEILIAVSTIIGPIAAVQIQKYLESWRSKRDARYLIFRTLMANRATGLSVESVQALNAIPIEFYGNKKINDKWEELFDHLTKSSTNPEIWIEKRNSLLNDLLLLIGKSLKYDFNIAQISKIYHPNIHTNIEQEQHEIRKNALRVLKGEQSLSLAIKEIPTSDKIATLQTATQ